MSWTPTDEQVEKAVEALADRVWSMTVGEAARAVLVAVGPHIAAAALRDAASATGPDSRVYEQAEVADWLHERADWIEKEAGR